MPVIAVLYAVVISEHGGMVRTSTAQKIDAGTKSVPRRGRRIKPERMRYVAPKADSGDSRYCDTVI